jgi:lipopolysaccharide/colanic/teichoic acid biosynthesis glycosyltransferase
VTLAAILLSILLALLSDEFLSWSPRLATWLVRRSVKRAPPHLRERLLEEWLADIDECPGRISKLFIALDTHRAACLIGHQFRLPSISYWSALSVRLFDVFVGILTLVYTAPPIILVIISIFIETKGRGPIFWRALRIGLDGQQFYVIRFATLSAPSNNHDEGVENNNRQMTKIGTIIRALRIDELPQLINVLKGEMSFVGPRPERPEFVAIATKHVDNYLERFRVRPGITGYAQVNHPFVRSADDFKKKHTLDIEYIRRYSLLLNLRVLVRTAYLVLFTKPA